MSQVRARYIPREQFMDFHARHQRFAVMVTHRRAGKTVAVINDIIDKCVQNPLPMPKYAYIAPFQSQAKEIAWSYLKYYTEDLGAIASESELAVKIPQNGARIRLFGADNPDALRGNFFDGIALDEYGDMTPNIFSEIVVPTLLDRKGWLVVSGTPKGPNHFHEMWENTLGDPVWFRRMWKASESGILTAEDLELVRSLPDFEEETFDQEYECSFTAAVKGSVYGKLLTKFTDNIFPSIEWDPHYPVITGWDLGIADPTAIWFAQRVGGELRLIDYMEVTNADISDTLDVVLSKPYSFGTCFLPHDAKARRLTGRTVEQVFQARGLRTHVEPLGKLSHGINAVKHLWPELRFSKTNCEQALKCLFLYKYEFNDKTKTMSLNPKHDYTSHCADALRSLAAGMGVYHHEGSAWPNSSPIIEQGMTLSALFAEREKSAKEAHYRRIA